MRSTATRLVVAIFALVAIAVALWHLDTLSDGLMISTENVGSTPVTVWRSAAMTGTAPVIVIAHGFAGSQQLMQPFATTLARNGYVVVTFDFPGHGRNPEPLRGGLSDPDAMQRHLLATLAAVAKFGLDLPASDGRLAVLGHSMAADIVVRYADANPSVSATVAVSLFLPNQIVVHPRNLLIIDGALEVAVMRAQALAIVKDAVDADVRDGVSYGDMEKGEARRVAFSRGVEHIGVLYSADSMHESLDWLNRVFRRDGGGFTDARGAWLGLLLLGLVMLAWPASSLLPRLAIAPARPSLSWPIFVAIAAAPALITPLLLWRVPTSFLPILLGDYLTLHFATYGLLTFAGIWAAQRRAPRAASPESATPRLRFVIAVVGVTAYSLLAIGASIDRFVFSFMPGSWRMPLIGAVLIGTLPYFLADEWLTRTFAAMRGSYVLTKICFLVSLVIAIALNLPKLFFLVIIVPAIVLLFLIYGILSRWVFRRTNNPFVAAFSNAIVFAWFVGVTFPIVSR